MAKGPAILGSLREKVQAKPRSGKKPMKTDELFHLIQKRAYELYLARNGSFGDPERDWLEAEKEIRTMYDMK